MSAPYRILLADDHIMFSQMIARSLRHFPGLEIVGVVGDGLELLKSIETTRPNLIVLDMEMPGLSGLEAAARLKQTHADVKILLFTMHKSTETLPVPLTPKSTAICSRKTCFRIFSQLSLPFAMAECICHTSLPNS